MKREEKIRELERIAAEIRLSILRMFSTNKAHHFGGSLSCVEIVTALYFYKMKYDKASASSPTRDRFIMSKGHTVPVQYAALARHGVIPEAELSTIKQLGSRLQGHPDVLKTPGLEAPTGSLGQGLSYANGIALAGRLDNQDFNVYVVVGDGELQEGQIWEAAMTTSHYRLKNLCVIVDRNKYQSQGEVDSMMSIEPLERKWESFGWETVRVDGHSVAELLDAFDRFPAASGKPYAIVADTVKGKGVGFMENTYKYHNFSLTEEEFARAEDELQAKLKELQ